MNIDQDKPKLELLAPAGDMEKLKTAVRFGADAVYFGGEMFSLRAGAGNFTVPEIEDAMDWLHANNAKGYMTINIYPHNGDISPLKSYISKIRHIPVDAFLVSDPGVMGLIKDQIPDAEIHLSTQANTTNYLTAGFWASQGVKRIVCAREMSLNEIRIMRDELPEDIEIEAFVHGAMCISYSGRCLLSNFMAGRDANRGACTHPCRWKYDLHSAGQEAAVQDEYTGYAIEEETRPGELFPIAENERGTYIMNSKDLCMIEHIPELIDAGVDSFKIEGRMKTALYVACVARTYRRAIDDYFDSPDKYRENLEWYKEEIGKCTTRSFTTGFYFGKPGSDSQVYDNSTYITEYVYLGHAEDVAEDGSFVLHQKNKFSVGEEIEMGAGIALLDDALARDQLLETELGVGHHLHQIGVAHTLEERELQQLVVYLQLIVFHLRFVGCCPKKRAAIASSCLFHDFLFQ